MAIVNRRQFVGSLAMSADLVVLLTLASYADAETGSSRQPVRVENHELGSLTPRGTRRWIYNSDPSNTTRHLSEPAAHPDELRQIVRNYAREARMDTLVIPIASSDEPAVR